MFSICLDDELIEVIKFFDIKAIRLHLLSVFVRAFRVVFYLPCLLSPVKPPRAHAIADPEQAAISQVLNHVLQTSISVLHHALVPSQLQDLHISLSNNTLRTHRIFKGLSLRTISHPDLTLDLPPLEARSTLRDHVSDTVTLKPGQLLLPRTL